MLSVRTSVIVVRGGNADFLVGLVLSLCLSTLESLTPTLSCSLLISVRVLSVVMRESRPVVRPIVLSVVLPTVPRVVSLGSRKLVVFLVPIVRPVREGNSSSDERRLVAACLFTDIDGSLLPITLPMPRLRSVRWNERVLFALGGLEGGELTAGCLSPVGAEELRAPITLPMRERWLVVGCLFVFETDGVMRLLESSLREAPLERAAGCSAPLGTDGLVVLILLPMREVMLVLILLFVFLVERFVITLLELLKFKLLLLELLTLAVPLLELFLFVTTLLEVLLLDGVLVVIMPPMRDVMLGLILLFELFRLPGLGAVVRELIDLPELPVPGVRFVITLLLPGVLFVMTLPDVLLPGVRFVMAWLDVLLLGVRFVMAWLDVLLLGAGLVIFLLGALLVMLLLEVFLLGALLLIVTLPGLLEEFALGAALGAGAGLDTWRL